MEATEFPHRVWAVGNHLFATNIKGISSMKSDHEFGTSQQSTWCILHRLWKAADMGVGLFADPVGGDAPTWVGRRTCPIMSGRHSPSADQAGKQRL